MTTEKSLLKRVAHRAALRLGYTVVPTWQIDMYHGFENMRKLFGLLSIDLVIDVGANVGQFRDALRMRVGYQGRVVSFEPIPDLARGAALRAEADPMWTVENRALGAAPGQATFNVMNDTQFSSFLAPRHDDVAVYRTQNAVRETVPVEVTTLDAILPPLIRAHAPRGVFLKLDTQGFDLEVLKGGASSLQDVAGLQTEASVRPIYDGSPGYREVLDFAVANGFVVSGFFSNNEGNFPELVEFDCQMIRKPKSG